jgi:hypothetical protein
VNWGIFKLMFRFMRQSLYSGPRTSVTDYTEDFLGLRAAVETLKNDKITCPYREWNPGSYPL